MIWVTWRQHSREAAVASSIVILIAANLVFEWFQITSASRQLGLGSCQSSAVVDSACGIAMNSFMNSFFGTSVTVRYVLVALPALLGVFVAAPLLAREVEEGTHMFIWTQSITRTRWFTVKVFLIASFTLVVAAALAATASWWHQPLDLMYADGSWTFFEVIGTTPVAYAIFALTLGVAMGTLIQHTVPAMATTLLLFVAARVAIHLWRPWFLAPMTKEYPIASTDLIGVLPISGPTHGDAHGILVYQPAERFWTFQLIETGIFLLLALLLITFSAWWLRHRIR